MRIFLNKRKGLLLGGLLLLIAASAYCYLNWKKASIICFPLPKCDPSQGPCTSSLPSGESVELRIRPTHMPVLTSLQLEIRTQKIAVKKIFVYFKGVEMNMGEFRYTLSRQKDGSYTAQTILPTCIHDNMAWHAVVRIEALNKHYKADFIVINKRPTH